MSVPAQSHRLILASTSAYRSALLERLGLPFQCVDPQLDERAEPCAHPRERARILARNKAMAIADAFPNHYILGSDQVAACDGRLLGKPGSRAQQAWQLRFLSGRRAVFHTAVALLVPAAPRSGKRRLRRGLVTTHVQMRTLRDAEIENYVASEAATDCCGGFRCEGLGIALFSSIRASDPTALEGLPLITTARLLRAVGYSLP